MDTFQQKQNKIFEHMKAEFGYKNKLAAPKVLKVVVSSGTGRGVKQDKNRNTLVSDRLAKITGQKPTLRTAKQSIATFKTRQGDAIGVSVTLRGKRMQHFLDKLTNIALPRTKDFRGISRTAVDGMGNLTIGIREHTIFPETSDEELRDVFGLAVTVVTTAKSKKEATVFFELLGVPFKKEEDSKKAKPIRKKK